MNISRSTYSKIIHENTSNFVFIQHRQEPTGESDKFHSKKLKKMFLQNAYKLN